MQDKRTVSIETSIDSNNFSIPSPSSIVSSDAVSSTNVSSQAALASAYVKIFGGATAFPFLGDGNAFTGRAATSVFEVEAALPLERPIALAADAVKRSGG